VSAVLLAALKIEMRIAIATILAALGPRTVATDDEAIRGADAASVGPSAARYATLASMYTPINIAVPIRKARGKLRCGLIVSPAL
jgi:hypothetical protein